MLARLGLRLAAIESLAPVGAASWPTVAGNRVYDSRIDPVDTARSEQEYADALALLAGRPLVTVYTEDQDNSRQGTEVAAADLCHVHLVFELMIAEIGQVTIAGPDGQDRVIEILEAGAADRRREAIIDLLEAQIRRVMDLRNRMAPLVELFVMELKSIASDPQRDTNRAGRLALRTLRYHLRIRQDAWGNDNSLPRPLADLFAALPDGSAKDVIALVADNIGNGAPAPLEGGIRIFSTLSRDASVQPSNEDLAHATFSDPGDILSDTNAAIGSTT